MIRILNLYSGLGGNRKYWEDVDVTAVEIDDEIAGIYRDFFPSDTMVIGDAHSYLLGHYKEFDFIWSSPSCTTHSKVRMMASKAGSYLPVFPDMGLWEEIVFLKHFAVCDYVVENVKPYYTPFVEPTAEIHRHYFWSNFDIPEIQLSDNLSHNQRGMSTKGFFDLRRYKINQRKDQLIRNSVNPEIGKYIANLVVERLKNEQL